MNEMSEIVSMKKGKKSLSMLANSLSVAPEAKMSYMNDYVNFLKC